ncbi:hypothetical protein BGZ60DRAFT_530968 [Tricladium varicosporioides]|nr:hypothetical protein BGZ60DRAFT_530968 [Hymenoscyphus varicosporioides]
MASNQNSSIQSATSNDSNPESDLPATVFDQNSRRTTLVGTTISPPSTAEASGSEQNSSDSEGPSFVGEIQDDHIENNDQLEDGWPKLAEFMTKTPDFAAFSRFRDLNIKSLLYYQAQLFAIRKKLRKQEYEDFHGGIQTKKFAKRADFLMDHEGSEQFKLIIKMREILKEYNEALLQYSQISALPEPDPYDMKNLRRWIRHPHYGNWCIRGDHREENTWGNIYEDPDENLSLWNLFGHMVWAFFWLKPPPEGEDLDLVATRSYTQVDGFTRWITGYLIPFTEAWKDKRQRKKDMDEESSVESTQRSQNRNCCLALPRQRCCPKRKERTAKDEKKTKATRHRIIDPKHWLTPAENYQVEPIRYWSENTIIRFTSGISTVTACLLPVAAITVLAQLHGTRNLLLCIAGCAALFSVLLIFLTQGISTRVEIFTATAAFSAVLVVFISPGNPQTESLHG